MVLTQQAWSRCASSRETSSLRVMSGSAAIWAAIQSSWPSNDDRRFPPWRLAAISPVAAFSCISFTAKLTLTPYFFAAASRDSGPRFMGALAAVASPQLLLLSLFTETGQWQAIALAGVADWMAVTVLATGGFVAAYSIWYGLLQRYNVDQIAPFVLLMPVAGVASAFIFLGERPTWPILAGGAIITLGVAIVVLTSDSRKLQTG